MIALAGVAQLGECHPVLPGSLVRNLQSQAQAQVRSPGDRVHAGSNRSLFCCHIDVPFLSLPKNQ